MATVDVHEARTNLSRLLARAEAGEDVVITRNGRPVARLVSYNPGNKPQPDAFEDKIAIDDGFFDPLPEEELKAWEGR